MDENKMNVTEYNIYEIGRNLIVEYKGHPYRYSAFNGGIYNKYSQEDIFERPRWVYDDIGKSDFNIYDLQGSSEYFEQISYEEFLSFINWSKEGELELAKEMNWSKPRPIYVAGFRHICPEEAEAFYEYRQSIEINGIPTGYFADARVVNFVGKFPGNIDLHPADPGYFNTNGKPARYKSTLMDDLDAILETIPESEIRRVYVARHDVGHGALLIPKKYINKIFVHRLHKDRSMLGDVSKEEEIEKSYTGEEEVFELDVRNPDPDMLRWFLEIGALAPSDEFSY